MEIGIGKVLVFGGGGRPRTTVPSDYSGLRNVLMIGYRTVSYPL